MGVGGLFDLVHKGMALPRIRSTRHGLAVRCGHGGSRVESSAAADRRGSARNDQAIPAHSGDVQLFWNGLPHDACRDRLVPHSDLSLGEPSRVMTLRTQDDEAVAQQAPYVVGIGDEITAMISDRVHESTRGPVELAESRP